VKATVRSRGKKEKKKREQQAMRPAQINQPVDRELRYENGKTALAEEGIIRLMLIDAQLFRDSDLRLSQDDFSNSSLKRIYSVLYTRVSEDRSVNIRDLSGDLGTSEISLLTEICQKPVDISNGERLLEDYINKMKLEKLKANPDDNLRDIFEKYRFEKGVEATHE
jgi:DnaB-like helicase N terminal domain.